MNHAGGSVADRPHGWGKYRDRDPGVRIPSVKIRPEQL